MNLPDLHCTILRGRYSTPQTQRGLSRLEHEIHNRAYHFWRRFWTDWADTTQGVNSGTYVQVDNFFKHELHLLVHTGRFDAPDTKPKLLASMALSVLNLSLDATYDLAYLKDYPPSSLSEMRAEAARHASLTLAITGEYLCVDPEFRKQQMGISLADTMVGLNMEMFKSMDARFALGTGLNRVKMPECCYQFGFQAVGSLLKCNLECTALINRPHTVRTHPNPEAAAWIQHLWNTRLDLTQSLFWTSPTPTLTFNEQARAA